MEIRLEKAHVYANLMPFESFVFINENWGWKEKKIQGFWIIFTSQIIKLCLGFYLSIFMVIKRQSLTIWISNKKKFFVCVCVVSIGCCS